MQEATQNLQSVWSWVKFLMIINYFVIGIKYKADGESLLLLLATAVYAACLQHRFLTIVGMDTSNHEVCTAVNCVVARPHGTAARRICYIQETTIEYIHPHTAHVHHVCSVEDLQAAKHNRWFKPYKLFMI